METLNPTSVMYSLWALESDASRLRSSRTLMRLNMVAFISSLVASQGHWCCLGLPGKARGLGGSGLSRDRWIVKDEPSGSLYIHLLHGKWHQLFVVMQGGILHNVENETALASQTFECFTFLLHITSCFWCHISDPLNNSNINTYAWLIPYHWLKRQPQK